MTATPLDYTGLIRSDLPPAAVKYSGFPKYNFVGGHNDADSIPVEGLRAAADAVLKREGKTLATYGLESGPQGYRPLRQFLVRKLEADAGISCTADDILITSGSLQGMDLVNQLLIAPGDTALIEQANYGGAITRLKRCKANIVSVPLDHDGMSASALSNALDDLKAKGVKPKYIYTIPTVQNPTATVMSAGRRREILALSEKHGVPIFEDECYADLTWSGERPQAFRGMAGNNRVIHIGSFSKSIAPALRLGYLVASWPLMGNILGLKTDAGSGALEQMVMAEYATAHFDSHVKSLRKALKRKADVLIESLSAEFGTAAEFEKPAGGIFLWIKLPDEVDTMRLFQAAGKAGIALNPGPEWALGESYARSRLRLCFANPSEAQIREGVAALADVCHKEFGVPVRGRNVGRG
ncbi:MAG: PLP-dependent aminotransferase family protein [Hyphomicrobiaceae bacterium]|nr:PLP-dependent aminotransferase family protein [Hyphomicrobiaceae bacterium]